MIIIMRFSENILGHIYIYIYIYICIYISISGVRGGLHGPPYIFYLLLIKTEEVQDHYLY